MRTSFIVAAVSCAVFTTLGQDQRSVFQTVTDAVFVDVSVTQGNRPIPSLTATDFAVLDNGVLQEIQGLSIEAVPIDATVLIDVSGSVDRDLSDFKKDVTAFAKTLRDADRLRVIDFAARASVLIPFTSGSNTPSLATITPRGGTAVLDAVFESLLHHSEPGRRHLVIVFTDADDNSSIVAPDHVSLVARQSDGLIYLVLPPHTPSSSSLVTLSEAAMATGGVSYPPGAFKKFGDAMSQVVDDFRHRYVLRYVPRGVTRAGWHTLDVTVVSRGAGAYTVRARKGYFGG
jgi:VWFA-related protein